MKRGAKFIPLPNPPVETSIAKEQGEILGIPVEFNSNHAGVADARGLFGRKRIVVGPAWFKLDDRMRRAVLLHEAAHCRGYHLEKRVGLIAAMFVPPLVMLPWTILVTLLAMVVIYGFWEWEGKMQEKDADAFAVSEGYGLEMARFLKLHHTSMPNLFYPDFEARMGAIERLLKQREGAKT